MKTFKDFLKEDKMAERLGKMSDAEFEQFLKGRSPQEVKTFTARRATYTSSGTAGQGVQNAQQTARNARRPRPSGTTSPVTPPRTPGVKPPGVKPGGLKGLGGPLVGGIGAGIDYVDRKSQGQSDVQAAGGAFSGWGGFSAGSALSAKVLAPIAALPIPGARIAYGAGVLGGGLLGSMGASGLFDAGYDKANTVKANKNGVPGTMVKGKPETWKPVQPARGQGNKPVSSNPNRQGGRTQTPTSTSTSTSTPTPTPPAPAPTTSTQTSTPTPTPPKPKPKPEKTARQRELDAINADKNLTPMQKWAKANPNLATAQREKERIRGTAQSDNPLLDRMKLRSGMRAGSPTVQDPKVQKLGNGNQSLVNNPNAARAANPSLLTRSMQSAKTGYARNNTKPLSVNVA